MSSAKAVDAVGMGDDGGAGALNSGVPSSSLEHPCANRSNKCQVLRLLMPWGWGLMVGPGC